MYFYYKKKLKKENINHCFCFENIALETIGLKTECMKIKSK